MCVHARAEGLSDRAATWAGVAVGPHCRDQRLDADDRAERMLDRLAPRERDHRLAAADNSPFPPFSATGKEAPPNGSIAPRAACATFPA
jgi:hypothetical protein